MKFRLIENWQRAHRFGSVQLSGVLAIFFGLGPSLFDAWRMIPDDLKEALPKGWAHWIATGGFVLVMLARVVQIDRGPKGANDGAR